MKRYISIVAGLGIILIVGLVLFLAPSSEPCKIVTYPSINPADYEPGGPWERGECSPSYPP